jgi:hypothetical protein
VVQVAKHLLSKHEALSSNQKKKKKNAEILVGKLEESYYTSQLTFPIENGNFRRQSRSPMAAFTSILGSVHSCSLDCQN